MTCGDTARTISSMNEQIATNRPEWRIISFGRRVAPAGGVAGLAGMAHLVGSPAWLQWTILGISAALAVASAVNAAIAHGRRLQSMARYDRVSADDHGHLVDARRAILKELAKPGLGRRRRRDLERTLQTLTRNPLQR